MHGRRTSELRPCVALEAAQLMARPGSNTFFFPSRKRGLLYLMMST